MKKVKITAIRKAFYSDLMEKYENLIEHACDIQEGQVWIANGWQRADGLCDSAWESMSAFVMTLAHGGGDFYDGWMKNPQSAMISCNDGFRPVSFYIEALTRTQTKQKTALRELTLSAVNHCTAINKEKTLLSLVLFLLLDYGYISKTALIFSTPSQVVVTAVDGASTTFALHIIMTMFGFNFVTADIAANGIFDNQHESAFVKSSRIRCAP